MKRREWWMSEPSDDGLPTVIQTEWPGKYAHVREVLPCLESEGHADYCVDALFG